MMRKTESETARPGTAHGITTLLCWLLALLGLASAGLFGANAIALGSALDGGAAGWSEDERREATSLVWWSWALAIGSLAGAVGMAWCGRYHRRRWAEGSASIPRSS